MTTAASKCLSLSAENMRKTLANSATFQTLVGAASATAALDSIYRWALPKPTSGQQYTLSEIQGLRPYAIISRRGYAAKPKGAGAYGESGTFEVELVRDIPEFLWDDAAEILMTWENTVGGIIDDLKALAGTEGNLIIGDITTDDGPWRNHPGEWPTKGRIQGESIIVDWGL